MRFGLTLVLRFSVANLAGLSSFWFSGFQRLTLFFVLGSLVSWFWVLLLSDAACFAL